MKIQVIDKKINEIEFWSQYLRLINVISNNNVLNDKEILVTSYILSLDINKSYFSRESSKIISKNLKNCSYSEINRVKMKLENNKIIEGVEDKNDKRQKVYYFNKSFVQLKKAITNDNKVEFIFNYEIVK